MLDFQSIHVLGHLENKPVDIGKWPLVRRHLTRNKSADATETGQIKSLGFIEHPIGNAIGEPTTEIAPSRVLLGGIVTVNDIEAEFFGVQPEANGFIRRVLTI